MRLSEADRAAFRAALDEYIAVQRYNADRGEAHMSLALLEMRRGNGLLADDHLKQAIAIDPTFVPAYVQLADLYRARRDEVRAEQILRKAIARNPDSASAHHSLGLALIRQRQSRWRAAGTAPLDRTGAQCGPVRVCLRRGAGTNGPAAGGPACPRRGVETASLRRLSPPGGGRVGGATRRPAGGAGLSHDPKGAATRRSGDRAANRPLAAAAATPAIALSRTRSHGRAFTETSHRMGMVGGIVGHWYVVCDCKLCPGQGLVPGRSEGRDLVLLLQQFRIVGAGENIPH